MATSATAYQKVGGFPRTSIEVAEEDVEYANKVAEYYGPNAIAYNPNMIVETSMRRVRKLGYLGIFLSRMREKDDLAPALDIR